MNPLREAAQLALETLELEMGTRRCKVAITALRAALAQQAEPVQEPVAVPPIDYDALIAAAYAANKKWAQGTNGCVAFKHGAEWFRLQMLPIHKCPQQDEPMEPVAKVELMMTGGNAGLATRIVEIEDHLRERLRPGQQLYTAPPQRKLMPLTEEEIYHATRHCGVSRYTAINIARAVEKASWEKNNGKA